jgi:murein DD-endopeptidase MepM/ murein hydrolase activator NlpD
VASPEFKARARIFGIGAACGFLAGAVLVALVVSNYPGRTRSAPQVAQQSGLRAATPPAPDGMADVDAPILEAGERVEAAPPVAQTAAPSPANSSAARSADPTSTIVPVGPAELKRRGLTIPVEGVRPEQLVESFSDERSGSREHEALDILAPRNTPVKAVEDGTIARLFASKAGGTTIYQFDPSGQFCYYYAHLERYADGLREGDKVRKGQVIGYVGTSGNAPKNTPHLHFAVFRLTSAKHWWEGTPIDPYPILR